MFLLSLSLSLSLSGDLGVAGQYTPFPPLEARPSPGPPLPVVFHVSNTRGNNLYFYFLFLCP